MLTAAQARQALRDRNLAHVAREIGMNRQQLWQIANGLTMPRADTLEKISDYLEGKADGAKT